MKNGKYKFFGALLSLLGFSSCNLGRIIDSPPAVEYGAPSVVYNFSGRAQTKTGDPIPGIRVVVAPYGNDYAMNRRDTAYTDAEGRVAIPSRNITAFSLDPIEVRFEDADGAENGSFETVQLKKKDLSIEEIRAASGWFNGEFSVSAEVRMDEKSDAE